VTCPFLLEIFEPAFELRGRSSDNVKGKAIRDTTGAEIEKLLVYGMGRYRQAFKYLIMYYF
jgi:hypothetical protein